MTLRIIYSKKMVIPKLIGFLFLIVINVVAAKYLPSDKLSLDDLKILEDTLKKITALNTPSQSGMTQGSNNYHGQKQKPQSYKKYGKADERAFIQTLNFIFKHNNINTQRPNEAPKDQKNILRSDVSIERCISCKNFPKLCHDRCGRTAIIEESPNTQIENIFKGISNPKQESKDDKLDELERALVVLNDNSAIQCEGTECEAKGDNKDSQEDEVVQFLNDLEDSLKGQDESKCKQGLKCGCSKQGQCGCSLRCGCDNTRCEDDRNDRSNYNMANINFNEPELQNALSHINPKFYKLNEDLDAFIIDAPDADELLRILSKNQPKTGWMQKQSNPFVKLPGKQNFKSFRRSSDSDSYGLPFELRVDGLGLINE